MVMDEDIDVEDDTQINDETEVVEPMENETNDESKESPNQKLRLVRLPLARIKTIMKLDPDCAMISQDSAFLVTKATVSLNILIIHILTICFAGNVY